MVAYGFKGQGVKRIPLLLSSCFYRKLGGNVFVPSPRIHAGSFSRSGNNAPKMTGFDVHWIALAVFVGLFLFVTVLGFAAARWKQGDLNLLDEWGLGGGDSASRSLGSWWAATSTPPTQSLPSRPWSTALGHTGFSRFRMRSSPILLYLQ